VWSWRPDAGAKLAKRSKRDAGDGDDACVEPSLLLKNHLLAAAPTFFPKSGHVLNLEEHALFNEIVERFIALVEAGRVRTPADALRDFQRPRLAKAV
jgi:3-oxoadipate enol-lactonase